MSKFDLTLHAWEQESAIELNLTYSTDLFERQTVERLLVHYEHL